MALTPKIYETRLLEYIDTGFKNNEITISVANNSRTAWNYIKKEIPDLKIPTPKYGPERSLTLTWLTGLKTLEMEFYSDRTMEILFYDRETQETWMENCSLKEYFSERFLKTLTYFISPPKKAKNNDKE